MYVCLICHQGLNSYILMMLYIGQERKFKQTAVVTQLNVIPLLANMVVMLNKPEAVDLIMPLFAESLAEGDASAPSLLRLKVKLVLPKYSGASVHSCTFTSSVHDNLGVINLLYTVFGAGT